MEIGVNSGAAALESKYEPEPESESNVVMKDLYIFLLVAYIVLPTIIILLRCFVIVNVPKKDLWFLFCTITSWSWVIWFIIIFGTDLVCTENCSLFKSAKDGGLGGWGAGIVILIIISFLFTFIFDIPYGLCDVSSSLFETTPMGEFQDILNRINNTGPTLTAGVMVETHTTSNVKTGVKTSFWGLVSWEQFPYLTWTNLSTPHPYFHVDQECMFNFEDLKNGFSYPKPLVIKTTLDVLAANEKTKEKYNNWKAATIHRITQGHQTEREMKEFVEEMVTDESLYNNHDPNHLIPSLQLPSLVTSQTENMLYHHMMEARDRVFCSRPPWWLHHDVYVVFTCLFLGSLYRVIYWTTVRVVRLHFRKSFNTEGDTTYNISYSSNRVPDAIHPYKNYVDTFIIKP